MGVQRGLEDNAFPLPMGGLADTSEVVRLGSALLAEGGQGVARETSAADPFH